MIMPGAVATGNHAELGVEMPGGEAARRSHASRRPWPADAARIMIEGIEKDKLHIYVGKDARFMNLAIPDSSAPSHRDGAEADGEDDDGAQRAGALRASRHVQSGLPWKWTISGVWVA